MSMKLIKRLLLTTGAFLCMAVFVLAGAGLYLYSHPHALGPVLERFLSAATGTSCAIESLSFSFQPMAIKARNVSLGAEKSNQRFSGKIPSIETNMVFEGTWGRRVLVLKDLRIEDGAITLNLPLRRDGESKPSSGGGWLQDLVGFFFFRDISLRSGELVGGQISVSWANQSIRADNLNAEFRAEQPIVASSELDFNNDERGLRFSAPCVKLAAGRFDIKTLAFGGTLQAEKATIDDPAIGIRAMAIETTFAYRHADKSLDMAPLVINCQGVSWQRHTKRDNEALWPFESRSVVAKTGLAWRIGEDEITLSPFDCDIKGLDLEERSYDFLLPLDLHIQAEIISSRNDVVSISDTTLQVPDSPIYRVRRDAPAPAIRLDIPEGRIQLNDNSFAFPGARFRGFGLDNVGIDANLKNSRMDLKLQGDKTGLLRTAAAYSLLPADLDISGADAVRIEAAGPADGPWEVDASLSMTDLAFSDSAGRLMGEAISIATKAQGTLNPNESGLTLGVDLSADAGEALLDRFYLNLSENPISAACRGAYRFGEGSLKITDSQFELTDILFFEIAGTFKDLNKSTQNIDAAVTIPQAPLKPAFYHFVQAPFGTGQTFLADLETGGEISAQLDIKKLEHVFEVAGHLRWRQGTIASAENAIALKGIHLDLPVWYRRESAAATAEQLEGRLEVQSADLPMLPGQSFTMPLSAGPNRLSVSTPTLIRTPGGPVRLGPVRVKDLYHPDISIQTSAVVDGINLPPFLSDVWEQLSEGSINGALDPIRYENNAISAEGEITAEVFGGKINISNLGASGLFTPAPVYRFDARFKDLRLAEMTTNTAFGKITGVLEGLIRHFELAYGQPQAFDLLLETVKKEGIPQKISVKAVENIAQIGSGQSPFMGFAGVFVSFFETFAYEKIGIRASLENDIFSINGTIKADDTEYLVKRGTFSGVNVVNRNPDNQIRWKDMVKRIKRITGQGDAVVK